MTKDALQREAYQKLEMLAVSFGLPQYTAQLNVDQHLGIATKTAMREFGFTDESLATLGEYDQITEVFVNRIVRHKVHTFRMASAGFFKYSTSTDGRTIDKTKVNDYLTKLVAELDKEYSKYKSKGIFAVATFQDPEFNYAYKE